MKLKRLDAFPTPCYLVGFYCSLLTINVIGNKSDQGEKYFELFDAGSIDRPNLSTICSLRLIRLLNFLGLPDLGVTANVKLTKTTAD